MIVVLLSSCREDPFSIAIDLEDPQFEKQLVIHCYVTSTTKEVVVSMADAKSIFDEDQTSNGVIGNISIYQDGIELIEFVEPIAMTSPNYTYKLQDAFGLLPGEIELRASAEGYPDVYATQKFPTLVPISNIDFEKNSYINNLGNVIDKFEITFNDPVDEENFYEVSVVSIDSTCSSSEGFVWDVKYIETRDLIANRSGNYNSITLSDETFNGLPYTLVFGANEVRSNGHNMQISWKCITKEQYQYSRSLDNFENQEVLGSFGQPVTLFSNTEGGIGFFGCAAHKTYALSDFEPYVYNKVNVNFSGGDNFEACAMLANLRNADSSSFDLLAQAITSEELIGSIRMRIENLTTGLNEGVIQFYRSTTNGNDVFSVSEVPILITTFDEEKNIISGSFNGTLFNQDSTEMLTMNPLYFNMNYRDLE